MVMREKKDGTLIKCSRQVGKTETVEAIYENLIYNNPFIKIVVENQDMVDKLTRRIPSLIGRVITYEERYAGSATAKLRELMDMPHRERELYNYLYGDMYCPPRPKQ